MGRSGIVLAAACLLAAALLLTAVLSRPEPSTRVKSRPIADGGVSQLPKTAGCVTSDGKERMGASGRSCAPAAALGGALDLATSADGHNVYVASEGYQSRRNSAFRGGGLAVFARDPGSGRLAQIARPDGCLTASGSDPFAPGACARVKGLEGAWYVAISPDDRNVYAIGSAYHRVTDPESDDGVDVAPGPPVLYAFTRNLTTGALKLLPGEAGCLTASGRNGATRCIVAAIGPQQPFAISPDGATVYLAGEQSGLQVLRRDARSGALRPIAGSAGCITASGRVPGKGPGSCERGRGVGSVANIGISPDGRSVYVASYLAGRADEFGGASIATFARRPSTGALTQLGGRAGCRYDRKAVRPGFGTGCQPANDVELSRTLIVAPDGRSVLLLGDGGDLVTFSRATDGKLRKQSTVYLFGDREFRDEDFRVALSPDARHLYATNGPILGLGSGRYGSLSVFARARKGFAFGRLRRPGGCVAQSLGRQRGPVRSPPCSAGRGIVGPQDVEVTADGRSVYVLSRVDGVLRGAITAFTRGARAKADRSG